MLFEFGVVRYRKSEMRNKKWIVKRDRALRRT